MALLAAVMLGTLIRRRLSTAGGVARNSAVATFLFAAVFLNFAWTVYTGFQLETIQAFFEAAAAWAAVEVIYARPASRSTIINAFTAGLATGLAGMVKPGGLGVGLAFVITLWFGRRTIGQLRRGGATIASFIAGVAVPVAITILYAIQSGAWPLLPAVLRQIERYADDTPMGFTWISKLALVAALLGFPMLVRGILAKLSHPPDSQHQAAGIDPTHQNRTPLLLFTALWFLVDLLAIILQRRMYPYHFLPLACPAALLYGLLPWRARPMHIAAGLLPIALLSFQWEGTNLRQINRGFQHDQLSEYVSSHTKPDDSVYTDQIGRLLIETGRRPGSRYGTFFYFANYDQAPLEYGRAMLQDFKDRRPVYIILRLDADGLPGLARGPIFQSRPQRAAHLLTAWQEIRTYINTHYTLETTIDGNDLYRRHE